EHEADLLAAEEVGDRVGVSRRAGDEHRGDKRRQGPLHAVFSLSSPRKRGSIIPGQSIGRGVWVPAFAGTTEIYASTGALRLFFGVARSRSKPPSAMSYMLPSGSVARCSA